ACPPEPAPHSGTTAPASGETDSATTAPPRRSSRSEPSQSDVGARVSSSPLRSSVGVLSSSVSLHIPLSARLPVTFRALLIFQLNRHRYEQINSASSLPWSHSNESSSVSKTASAPYSTAEDANR